MNEKKKGNNEQMNEQSPRLEKTVLCDQDSRNRISKPKQEDGQKNRQIDR